MTDNTVNVAVDIERMVKNEIRQKRELEDAFIRICQTMKLGCVSKKNASDWIQRFKLGDRTLQNDKNIGTGRLDLLKVVATFYFDHQHLIYEQRTPIFNLVYLSNRYFMVFDDPDWKINSLSVYDIYHGQTQQLVVKDAPKNRFIHGSSFQAHSIDPDHLLIAEDGSEKLPGAQGHVYSTYLYLVHIEYSKWNGQISHWTGLDTVRLGQFYLEEKVLFHPEDRKKFTLFESDEFFNAIKGRIVDGKIVLTKKLTFDKRVRCKRLLDENRVQGIQNVFNAPTNTYGQRSLVQTLFGVLGFNFSEHSLHLNTTNQVQDGVSCSSTPPACADWFHVSVFKWSNERLYIELIFLRDSFSVYSFDPQTGQARSTGLAALGRDGGGSIIDMHVDNNEVLTLAVMGNSRDSDKWPLSIYRYPTKNPDTLQNIVWQSIRRLTMNFDGQRYGKVLHLLGNNSPLMPFSKKLC